MKVVSYIEKVYSKEKNTNISIIGEVDTRDYIVQDSRMDGFRYFDILEKNTFDGEDLSNKGNRFNIGPWVYLGKRYAVEDAKIMFPCRDKEIESLEDKYSCEDICLTRNNKFIPLTENDLTYSEYLGKKNDYEIAINEIDKKTKSLNEKEIKIVAANMVSATSEKDLGKWIVGSEFLFDLIENKSISKEVGRKIIFLNDLINKNIPVDFILREIDFLQVEFDESEIEYIKNFLAGFIENEELNIYLPEVKSLKIKRKK